METDSFKYRKVQKRVAEIKGFRVHATIYVFINLMIILGNGISHMQAGRSFFQFYMLFTPLFWGIGLGIHGIRVFVPNFLFGAKWEERQIARIMAQEDAENEGPNPDSPSL
ncbi:MAG: hypothetical protein RLZZ241_1188 [Bacteroidota bacterium]|jgi:hypothetical protein